MLVAKVIAVAGIGLLGAHNHRVVVPGLKDRPRDATLMTDLRRTTLMEAGLFVVVVVLTGILVMADAT